MPVIICHNCSSKIKIPDHAGTRQFKCPKCATELFSIGVEAAVEAHAPVSPPVVAPPPPPPPPPPPVAPPPSPFSNLADDEEEERPKKRRKRDDDDDEDEEEERPKKRRKRDDDDDEEEEERPKKRRKRDDDDDDEEEEERPKRRKRDDDDDDEEDDDDDRPRKRRKRDDDDDEDDPRAAKKRMKKKVYFAKLSALLVSIGLWVWAGSAGLVMFGILLGVFDALSFKTMETVLILGGVVGLIATGTSSVGFGFAIAGPTKKGGMGLAIATVAVAALHFLLLFISIIISGSEKSSRGGGGAFVPTPVDGSFIAGFNVLEPFLFLSGIMTGLGATKFLPWQLIVIPLFEVARFVVYGFYLRSMGLIAKDRVYAKSAMVSGIVYGGIALGQLLGGVIIGLILESIAKGMGKGGGQALIALGVLIAWGLPIATMCLCAFQAIRLRSVLRRF